MSIAVAALEVAAAAFHLGPLDLDVPAGAFGTLLGRSGAGKTTLLRALAGLLPAKGEVVLGGLRCDGVPPDRRPIGWVPQGGGLFPHLTALGNVELVRRPQAPPARELLDRAGAAALAARRPHALSGGETLRVALARALGRLPPVLLLDEPLAAIDGPGRLPLLALLAGLARSGTTLLQVTHDAAQALQTSDWIGVIDGGRLAASGPFVELLSKPLPPAARRVLGADNVLAGRFTPAGDGLSTFRSPRVELSVPGDLAGDGCVLFPASAVALAPPPEALANSAALAAQDRQAFDRPYPVQTSIRNHVRGRIFALAGEGPMVEVTLDCGLSAEVTRSAAAALALREGSEIVAEIKATALHPVLRTGR